MRLKLKDLGGTLSPVMSVGECSRNTMVTNATTANQITFSSIPKLNSFQQNVFSENEADENEEADKQECLKSVFKSRYSVRNDESKYDIQDQTTGTSLRQTRQTKRINGQKLYKKLVTCALPMQTMTQDMPIPIRTETPDFD